ncbi:MAG: HAD hydrolase family protein [Clostridia bacterium]|nr:HAD hydrolase family protein [Clostridia bacterium]
MGKYSGLLICADFDGTLVYNGQISPGNLDAIRRFQQGGGWLTLATGRYPNVLRDHGVAFRCNAPLICMNGAILYDEETEKALYEGFIEESCEELLLDAIRRCQEVRELVFCMAEGRRAQHVSPSDIPLIRELCGKPLYKILIHVSARQGVTLRDYLREKSEGRYLVDRSWHSGVEIQGIGYDKGKTARRLANMLDADSLLCIGDFDNDLSMIREADVGYAMGNATEELKAAADRITASVEEDGFAQMIDEL